MAITPRFLKVCGSATHSKGTPIICSYTEPSIDHAAFLQGLSRIIEENQTDSGPCVGCRYLTTQSRPQRFASFLSTVSLHDFCGCNASCVYCVGSEYKLPVKYKASLPHTTLFTNLLLSKQMRPGVSSVGWGGGEPTLLDTFEDTVDLLRVNRIWQTINTNGIVFSRAVLRALKMRQATVRISVDSGKNETYIKIKRNPHHEAVWDSIHRYADSGGDFVLKYIVIGLNANQAELHAFVERACGVKRICISADAHGEYAYLKGTITHNELTAAAYLYNLAKEQGMEPYFEPIWSKEHLATIEKLGHFKVRRRHLPVELRRQVKRLWAEHR